MARQTAQAKAYYASEKKKLAKLDPRMPSAHGVRPLFRVKLVEPELTNLGYHLIDVIAVVAGEREPDSKHTFPTYVCLALNLDNKWTPIELCDYDGSCEFDHAYEVVS